MKNLSETELSLKSFETTFSWTIEKFASLQLKYLRYNNSPFMNRTFRKAIMTRFNLKRRYNFITTINSENYKKQRNVCVNLSRKIKKQYFNNNDVKYVTDNKKFWKNIRPKSSNKHNYFSRKWKNLTWRKSYCKHFQ